MNEEIQRKIDELVMAVRHYAPVNAVSFSLFVNSSEYESEFGYRDARSLQQDGISMRALNGQFIKD